MNFKRGDVVRHIIGGPDMWVVDAYQFDDDEPKYVTCWFSKNDEFQIRYTFCEAELVIVKSKV